MSQNKEQQENSVTVLGGLHTDSSLLNQPPGTTRFVLNGIDSTKDGDEGYISNEESNELCYHIPQDGIGRPYTPVGKCYIGDETTLLFFAHINGNSLIATLDKECNLTIEVDDATQVDKLGFKISHQIDATFRLRRGCERTVYFVDPKPRIFCLDRPEKFKNPTGAWEISKFDLFKKVDGIPQFDSVETIEGAGVLPPGSYNAVIQYLDEDFNPTAFKNSCETVSIYNSPLTAAYKTIKGSTKEILEYQKFTDTNKAIEFKLSNLDTNYPFYRLAIIEANKGDGLISDVKVTSPIGTTNDTFVYTGVNYQSSISIAEVTAFIDDIESAQSIEQIENRLVLGNTKSKQINYCSLQKYASKINVDVITREVVVSSLDASSPKDPSLNNHGVGYMPGEIYSLGIVYILDDYSETPAFHIPGKDSHDGSVIFSPGPNVYPMSARENVCNDTKYTDNNSCNTGSFWGKDSTGHDLVNTAVRHHRLPLRTDLQIPLVTKVPASTSNIYYKNIKVTVAGSITVPVICTTDEITAGTCTPTTESPFTIKVNYSEDGETNSYNSILDPSEWAAGQGDPTTVTISKTFISNTIVSDIVSFVEIYEEGTTTPLTIASVDLLTGIYTTVTSPKGLVYTIQIAQALVNTTDDLYKVQMLGLKFSNIDVPSSVDLGGRTVIGYYIVRHERTENERTILDSAVVYPTIKYSTFVSHGLLKPEVATSDVIQKDLISFVNPEFKFNKRNYTNFTSVIEQGYYEPSTVIKSRVKINDVSDGSGYDPAHHKHGRPDDDGFTIQIKTRDSFYDFYPRSTFETSFSDLEEVFYLDALADKNINYGGVNMDVFNLACDNKVGFIKYKNNFPVSVTGTSLPYVYFYRKNLNPYSNYRLDPMYKEMINPKYFGSTTVGDTVTTFNGDSYISSIKYVNSVFYDNRMKQRAGQTSAWNYVIAAVLVVAAVLIEVFSVGVGTFGAAAMIGVAASLVGAATALTMSGIKQGAWRKAYNDLYDKGLRNTIADSFLQHDIDPNNPDPNKGDRGFVKNPADDEIQWLGDASNLWFESGVNMGLRNGSTDNTPTFIDTPSSIESGTTYPEDNDEYFGIDSVASTSGNDNILPTNSLDTHMYNKLTYADYNRKAGRAYIGLALAEVYNINKDYLRRDRQKVFYPLGLEYDCCSDCVETFPHRWSWSEQSFQEELTDNFRTFLPNNYKDLEAETGPITDIFRIQNNLYIHTTEGLWHCPQTFQERVTSDIVSFIGTGEYFSIPPRKIVDDSNSSAGNRHKWARTKTKYGVLFPSHKEKKWYLFNGEKLQPISDNGNEAWFRNNMRFLSEENYYNTFLTDFPYSNNPSSPIGVGYLSTYDTAKERFIVTKKDIVLTGLPEDDYEICTEGEDIIVFENISGIISARELAGWTYLGIVDCRMKFIKTVSTSIPHSVFTSTWIPPVTEEVPMDPSCKYVSVIFITVGFEMFDETTFGGGVTFTVVDCNGISHSAFGAGTAGEIGGHTTQLVKFHINACVPFDEEGNIIMDIAADEGTYYTMGSPIMGSGECTTLVTTPGYFEYTEETYYTEEFETVIEYENGTELDLVDNPPINNGWTMSYNLKKQQWRGWHSYIPSFYFHVQNRFYSWNKGLPYIYKHNVEGSYQTFYGVHYPFIVEYVDNEAPLQNKIYSNLMFQTEAKKWDSVEQEYFDQRNVTFNKMIGYNTQQITGVINMIPKLNSSVDYLYQQTLNSNGTSIILDRNEKDWTINDLRDYRIDYTIPMFIKDPSQFQGNYFIDKIVNPAAISYTKDWTQLESFRDKFLVVRLIFDNFADTRLSFNYATWNKNVSER